MSDILYNVFIIVSIIGALFSAIFEYKKNYFKCIVAILIMLSAIGIYITGNFIGRQKEKEIFTLKQKINSLEPRKITEEQQKKLINDLENYNQFTVGFISHAFDYESKDYADQLSDLFKKAKFSVTEKKPAYLGDMSGYLTIATTNESKNIVLNNTGVSICNILSNVGIDCKIEEIRKNLLAGEGRQENAIYIIIGHKK